MNGNTLNSAAMPSVHGGKWGRGIYKASGHPDQPLVTIITVVFNGVGLLEKTIQSVINQTYEQIEYIIIDGGSNDGTVDLLRKYDEQIDYWISERDSGIYDAMNKAQRIARGDYIWFMNAGDCIYQNGTLKLIFEKGAKYDFYYGDTQIINSNGSLGSIVKAPKHIHAHDFYRGMLVSHQSILVARHLTSNYCDAYKLVADQKWIIDALNHSKNGLNTNLVLSRYLLGGISDRNSLQCVWEKIKIAKHDIGVLRLLIYLPHYSLEVIKCLVKRLIRRS